MSRSPDPLGMLAHMIDSLAVVNITSERWISGRRFLQKRRRGGRGWIIRLGNIFLRLSHSRIHMFMDSVAWQAWETQAYAVLHGRACLPILKDAILIEPLPGQSLKTYLESGALTAEMMQAAALEFKRCHGLINGLWSHGDPHLNNVLYDEVTKRAYLIDFETRHDSGLTSPERHADDLLVFLLDVLGRDSSACWLEHSRIFLDAYADAEVLEALAHRLVVPRGLELVLWKTRTNHLPTVDLTRRLELLCQLVAHA